MSVLITLFAGLGFIFIGTQFLTANMKQVVGARFHKLVARATGHPVKAAAVGVAAGAVIQSTNAVTFIVVSLIGAGAATVREAMPIVTWSYAGSTLRLLLASLDLGTAVMLAVGLIGMAFLLGYDRSAKHRHLVAALLGLVLLLYGVQLMNQAAVPLRQSEWLRGVLAFADRFYFWGFLAGTLLASVIQGQTVSVIAVALADGGLLGLDQTILVVIGANLGTGIQALIQGAGLKGTSRQLNLYQLVLKLIGVAVLLPLLTAEHYAGLPGVKAAVGLLTQDVAFQVTAVHWAFQIVSALVASVLNRPLYRVIERMSPPTGEEILSRPEHIDGRAAVQPLAALSMVEQEQARLLHRLPDFLAGVREDASARPLAPAPVLRSAGNELARAIDAFLKSTLQTPMPPEELDRLMRRWNCNELLLGLQDALAELATTLEKVRRNPEVARIADGMAESLHMMLLTLAEEADPAHAAGPAMLETLTADRSALMRRIREDLTERLPDLPVADRQAVWRATDLFERLTWLMRRYAVNLPRPAEDPASPMAGA
ncbi:Na/Pi symporter [Azospirillum thermophilum]|uniref:Na/Pi cotransporter family protein n=1 Tax=Azospirillum thermophilum TaxID=2202148 RepID=A0A2S2CV24_9PROT|nr:Na/Pi symporter [Azospirillum thermophilum]AWK88362.1 hypothetical protein DEW08_19945 [Azospirillum thermophilum]